MHPDFGKSLIRKSRSSEQLRLLSVRPKTGLAWVRPPSAANSFDRP
jgi:hypothetical protein